ncbi:MAG: biotin--[acetyl-CoA-carboxylase] ligase [Oscillospiraceae bacterium]|nr:biotin--[acetyl-CoA-carboxylase] ligase [Oscillospiraceae bacterium]MDE5884573.1 biotin--[acetyl-CoA-carboxylase] ligase [Oscillospiraceae bacterium]
MNLRESVLSALLCAEHYISGAELAADCQVSRSAVWKVVEQLRAEGCEIESVPHRGYRLVCHPDLFCESYLKQAVRECRTDWQFQHFKELDSTNNLAKTLAARNAPSGTVVIADRQTAGKGRTGKSFYSPAGNLYFSIIEKLTLPISDMMSVTACTAAAVFLALKQFGITAQIKWVNDLFLNQKKICGILSEGSFNAELLSMDYLVIGIGINLRHDPDRPEELQSIITDLETETGKCINKYDLLIEILKQLEILLDGIPSHSYLEIYTKNSCTLGHRIRTDDGMEGIATGFTEDAGLIIELADGTKRILRTGSAMIVN